MVASILLPTTGTGMSREYVISVMGTCFLYLMNATFNHHEGAIIRGIWMVLLFLPTHAGNDGDVFCYLTHFFSGMNLSSIRIKPAQKNCNTVLTDRVPDCLTTGPPEYRSEGTKTIMHGVCGLISGF